MLTPAGTCSHRIDPAKRRRTATKLANSGCITMRKHAHRTGGLPRASAGHLIAGLSRPFAAPAALAFGHDSLERAHGEQRLRHAEIDGRLQDHLLHLVEGDAE